MNHLHQLYEPDQLIHDLTQNDLEHEYHVNSANNAFGLLGLTSSTTFYKVTSHSAFSLAPILTWISWGKPHLNIIS